MFYLIPARGNKRAQTPKSATTSQASANPRQAQTREGATSRHTGKPNRPTAETLNSIQGDLNNWYALFTEQDFLFKKQNIV